MNRLVLYLTSLLCLLFLGNDATGQVRDRVPSIGILTIAAGPSESIIQEFRAGLRKYGYIPGQSVRVELRSAQGHLERLPALAAELVKLKVDVIVAGASVAGVVTQATGTIPVVIVVHEADPMALRLIEDFSHPGGNLTGVYARESELVGKRLELLKEALPSVTRIAVLWEGFSSFQLEKLNVAARSLSLEPYSIEVDSTYDFASAFKRAKRMRADASMVLLSPGFYVRRDQIAAASLRAGLPTMFQNDVMVQAGGLMSYGTSFTDTWGRAAYFVDRLLRGAKPSELPVEQVSRFRLAVNLKTARALRLTMPESILLRADEVIR